ncbi:hypothetical protein E8E13_006048 [Curvularia kusanoi]|uniref:Protein kinase domain-containing protein n=1 Tax=Curvularia kusanoi TaxID=90978 RepID=A0A9P4TBQ3_CURKU|nr:hypothetical protein E8E13_006048 [Curvularia kusanoi]
MLQAIRSCRLLLRRPWEPLTFSSTRFAPISADNKVEEENLPGYVASRYYPVRISEIFRDNYQVVGKLGYGATSTVWLARDLSKRRHVALKLFIKSESIGAEQDNELDCYKRIENTKKRHPGREAVRSLLDSFDVEGPDGQHRCLVHPPLWESILDFRYRNSIGKLPPPIIAFVLKRLFQALDFLHDECHIAHTDIKEANILIGADDYTLKAFEEQELKEPSPRKDVDGRTIFLSRQLNYPKHIGQPVLCDFGSAVMLDDGTEHQEDIQPNVYRAPEVILDIPWTYSVDIWNVGCMVSSSDFTEGFEADSNVRLQVWDAFEGEHLFTGHDPELATYRGRAHLAEMIALLGPPPCGLLARASLKSKFFSNTDEFNAGIPLPDSNPLEQRLASLEGEDRELFLSLMRKMLQWEPEKRSSAGELAQDDWILKHTS